MQPMRQIVGNSEQTYFVSSQTALNRPLFADEQWATQLLDVILSCRVNLFHLHAYVIMPDRFYLLISPEDFLGATIRSIKGNFSLRARKSFAWQHQVWRPGYSGRHIAESRDWNESAAFILDQPIERGLSERFETFPYMASDLDPIPQWLTKTLSATKGIGGTDGESFQKQVALPLSEKKIDASC